MQTYEFTIHTKVSQISNILTIYSRKDLRLLKKYMSVLWKFTVSNMIAIRN